MPTEINIVAEILTLETQHLKLNDRRISCAHLP